MSVDAGLLARVRVRLAGDGGVPSPGRVAAALREEGGALRGDAELLGVLRALQSEIAGAGVLEPLLADPTVTDVLVNGPHEVWVDRGQGLERTAVRFADDLAVRRLAVRLAAPSGRRLDDAQPWVDARLANGVRLHAVLPPVAPGGTCLSLRVPRRRVFDLEELVAAGSVPLDGADLLRRLVAARTAFLVTGGTGTGKTTLLSALLSVVDVGDRVLLVEDAGELPKVVLVHTWLSDTSGPASTCARASTKPARATLSPGSSRTARPSATARAGPWRTRTTTTTRRPLRSSRGRSTSVSYVTSELASSTLWRSGTSTA